jgi:hypothetical protein
MKHMETVTFGTLENGERFYVGDRLYVKLEEYLAYRVPTGHDDDNQRRRFEAGESVEVVRSGRAPQ